MKSGIEHWLLVILLVVVGGLVISVAAFFVTSYTEVPKLLGGPDMVVLQYPGWDAWTGLPHGLVIEATVVDGKGGSYRSINESMPPDMVGRRAIPLPVGFALGAVVTIGVLAVRSRNHRSTLGATA